MNSTATPRQTARNNATLRAVKAAMNGKVYAKFASTLNDEGQPAAMAFLQRFFNVSIANRF